jgi:hypothetical protein
VSDNANCCARFDNCQQNHEISSRNNFVRKLDCYEKRFRGHAATRQHAIVRNEICGVFVVVIVNMSPPPPTRRMSPHKRAANETSNGQTKFCHKANETFRNSVARHQLSPNDCQNTERFFVEVDERGKCRFTESANCARNAAVLAPVHTISE